MTIHSFSALTSLPTLIYTAQKEKEALLKEHDITIYICYDLWMLSRIWH